MYFNVSLVNDGKIEKPNYEELLKKSRGYAAGGEIPIMAQEGEYVINKNSAQDIGYHNLEKFNKGGLTALKKLPKYHSGGVVQKFARGGDLRPNDDFFRGGVNYGPDPDPISRAEIKQKEKATKRKRALESGANEDR